MGAAPPFDSSTSLSRHRATSRGMQPGPWDADAGDVQPSTAKAPSTSCGAYRIKSMSARGSCKAAASRPELMDARPSHI
jgi:hypothetical protein